MRNTKNADRGEISLRNSGLDSDHCRGLESALTAKNIDIDRVFLINWIPEQGEDVYVVMVSVDRILIIEIPRADGEVQYEEQSVVEYRKGCSRHVSRKILTAQELLRRA